MNSWGLRQNFALKFMGSQARRFFWVMSHKHKWNGQLLMKLEYESAKFFSQSNIQRRERLIQKEGLRIPSQSPHESQPLFFAPR